MIFKSDRKKNDGGGRHSQALLLGNDEKNVIGDKVLSYFQCLSSKFEVYVTHFGVKK